LERTYSRWFREDFDFAQFNQLSLKATVVSSKNTLIAAIDCSFIKKSGKKTYGLAKFYNGQQSRAEKGLEISTLAVVDVDYNTAYNISTHQTPATIDEDKTRVDCYISHIKRDRDSLPKTIRYIVGDAYYSKVKFIDGVVSIGLEYVGKLRHDANLRWLYTGEQKAKGRHRRYDGKVRLNDLNRLDDVGDYNGGKLYTAVVNSVRFKRDIRISYWVKKVGNQVRSFLLFSTDIEIKAQDMLKYYKARFQIEFLFRDAKQFTGLTDCQSRHKEALNFHFNMSMTTLNLLKLEDRQQEKERNNKVISIGSWKIRKANEYLLKLFLSKLGLNLSSIKSSQIIDELRNHGAVAA